jgi:hypothetical protein
MGLVRLRAMGLAEHPDGAPPGQRPISRPLDTGRLEGPVEPIIAPNLEAAPEDPKTPRHGGHEGVQSG